MRSEFAHHGKYSTRREYRGLLDHGIFEPIWQSVDYYIDAKWVLNWKADEFGWPTKTNSRLVARGGQQRMNMEFRDLFAPTVAVSSVRLLTASACELNMDLCHFDIKQAFVQSNL